MSKDLVWTNKQVKEIKKTHFFIHWNKELIERKGENIIEGDTNDRSVLPVIVNVRKEFDQISAEIILKHFSRWNSIRL